MPRVPLILTPEVRGLLSRIASFCADREVAAWATGGLVRDLLGARSGRDIDITIAGDTVEIGRGLAEEVSAHYVLLDQARGHVRLVLKDESGQIDLTPLRAADIYLDLVQRDFTINAMAMDLAELVEGRDVEVLDPMSGRDDLTDGLVRATSEDALIDDPLRLLRGVRIATELDLRIEDGTAEVIRRNAPLIHESSAERVRDELLLVFSTERAAFGLRLMDELGLFANVLPEMEVVRGVEQPKEHSYDVLAHSLAAVAALDAITAEDQPQESPGRDLWGFAREGLDWAAVQEYLSEPAGSGSDRRAILKLGGLLHDVGKPETKSFQPDGRMRFFGHSEAGARIAGELMRRLRFSSRETAIVQAMIAAHLRPLQMAQSGAPSKRAIYRFFRDTAEAGVETLLLSLADHAGTVGPRLSVGEFQRHVALVDYVLQVRFREEHVVSPPRLMKGDDLASALGLEEGPIIGLLMEAVREAQAAGEVAGREGALAVARRELERLSGASQ